MAELPISDEAVEAAVQAYYSAPRPDGENSAHEQMGYAIRTFLAAEGAQFYPTFACNCDGGEIEDGPPGATWTRSHPRCHGYGRLQRIVIEKQVPDA